MCITESPENNFFTGMLQSESIPNNSNFQLNAASRRLEKAYLTKKGVTKNIPRAGVFSGTPMENQIFGYHNTIQTYSIGGHAGGYKHKMRQSKTRGTGTD